LLVFYLKHVTIFAKSGVISLFAKGQDGREVELGLHSPQLEGALGAAFFTLEFALI
jgi:hypothetical protein